jgi:chaperonin GroES
MPRLKKKLIVVGDKLLVRPEDGEERTNAGLYLPPGAAESRQAKAGWVVSVGPGVPVFIPTEFMDSQWSEDDKPLAYVPMQAQEGDYVLFMQKAAVEITFEKKNYLIVPNSAVLVLVREDWDGESPEWEGDRH